MRLSIFLHIIAVMFFTTAAQAVDYWRPIFFTNQIAIANGSNILSAIYSGNARTKERVRALIGSQVVFYGGTAPRGANANLIVGTNIIVEIEIRPFRDVRPPHSVAWGADVMGTLKSVDFVKRVIHIRAKPEDWKVREGVWLFDAAWLFAGPAEWMPDWECEIPNDNSGLPSPAAAFSFGPLGIMRDKFMSDPSTENAQLRNEAIYEFTDRIVSISIGLLALSVTFRNSVIGSHPQAAWLIKTTWVACAVSGVCGIVWRFSKVTVLHSIAIQLASGFRVAGAAPHWYQFLSLWLCIIGFLVGILSLTVFGFLNI